MDQQRRVIVNRLGVRVSIIVIELLVILSLFVWFWVRPVVSVATLFPDDPLIGSELHALSQRAVFGGAAAWKRLGDAFLGKGAYRYAERAYKRASLLAPKDIDSRFALALCIDRTGRMAESNTQYRMCLAMDEASKRYQVLKPFALYAIGRNFLRMENQTKAEAAFRENEGFMPADYQLARILFFTDRPREALKIVDRGLERLPLSLEWHRLRGRILESFGQTTEAFEAYCMEERSAHLLEVNFHTDFIQPLTIQYGLQRMIEECRGLMLNGTSDMLLERLDEIDSIIGDQLIPERLTALQMRAEVLLKSKEPNKMLAVIDAYKKLGGSIVDVLAFEAEALSQLGRTEDAIRRREQLLALSPSRQLHLDMAERCDARDERKQAAKHRSKADLLDGIAAYRRNDLSTALDKFEDSVREDPTNAYALFHQGEMLFHLMQPEQASQALHEATVQRPGFGRAQEYLSGIKKLAAQNDDDPG